MTTRLETSIGALRLKNPVIAGPAEHLIDPDNVRRALRAGVGAVVLKSTNESEAAREQLERAEYAVFDAQWRAVPWGPDAPDAATVATRSGLARIPFDRWLEQAVVLDREARRDDAYAVPSIIVADLARAVEMARQVDQAGLRALELNIGTPYGSEARTGAVTTEFDPSRATAMVAAVAGAVSLPVWVKLTGQSERVPDLVQASFDGGGAAVIVAGRLLGLIPDVETMQPALGTSLGIGGYWNLPLTCHWLALSRARMGPEKPMIGVNGAQSGLDVARMMLAGAHAVEIATAAMLRGLQVLSEAVAELERYLGGKGVNARDLIGRAADARRSFASLPPLPDNWKRYVPESQTNERPTLSDAFSSRSK
jgi:dihydroorotate dehydrogenase (NAD+) catalytic subunit